MKPQETTLQPIIYIVHPEQQHDLGRDPEFVPACQYKNHEVLEGEIGGYFTEDGKDLRTRFIAQSAVYKHEPTEIGAAPKVVPMLDGRLLDLQGMVVSGYRRRIDPNSTRTTMVVPLYGLPDVPELFRPPKADLDEPPFGLSPVGLVTKMLASPWLLSVS
jgi:hypothetical protein